MIRKLLIVFISGLVLSILLISSAWVVGGDELLKRSRLGDGWWSFYDGDRSDGPDTVRSFAFDGSKVLKIRMPLTLQFSRGDKSEMIVSGPARMIDALRWENGELSLGRGGSWPRRGLTVRITAPQFAGLDLRGPGHVELRDLDQPSLVIDTRGPANVDASGKVAKLEIDSRGVGSLDFADVAATDANVEVHGVGNVDISATGNVAAELHGVGNVTLHRKPAHLQAESHGIGGIRHHYEDSGDEER